MKKDDASTRSWDAIADDWVRHADTNDYRNLFLLPLTLQLLGDIRGKRILDLGCGEGGYSRELVRRGATVVGVDGSERLIDVARERARAANVEVQHICANANALDDLNDASFDVVLAAMSLMDIEDYEGAVAEIDRVLAAGGELLMSITHPFFLMPADRSYFDRSQYEELIAKTFQRTVTRWQRPLEDFMRPLIARHFILRDFREPMATDDDVTKSPRFERMKRVPYFIFMRWEKERD